MRRHLKSKSSQNGEASTGDAGAARSISRVVEILVLLGATDQPIDTMTIARRCAIPKSSAYRLLNVLAARGFVERLAPGGGWVIGSRVRELGAAAPTIDDGVRLLATFHGSAWRAQPAELAREARLGTVRVQTTLAALRAAGLVVEDDDGRYRLGPRLATLAAGRELLDDIRLALRPHLVNLRDRTGETANLLVRSGSDALYIDQVESRHALRHAGSIGRLVSLHDTAAGAALTHPGGAAPQVVSNAVQPGVTAIACAIQTTIEHELTISVTGPTARLQGAAIQRTSTAVVQAAANAGRSLELRHHTT
ncbi:MAG TPA: helix-turn-helix domain-containing protein [Solirubrobacteraceae bacterium]|nr:helix-turn-helix domain-containing protein [Solirubrobacteraceae bacterium]